MKLFLKLPKDAILTDIIPKASYRAPPVAIVSYYAVRTGRKIEKWKDLTDLPSMRSNAGSAGAKVLACWRSEDI
jgi:hypothetical protein